MLEDHEMDRKRIASTSKKSVNALRAITFADLLKIEMSTGMDKRWAEGWQGRKCQSRSKSTQKFLRSASL